MWYMRIGTSKRFSAFQVERSYPWGCFNLHCSLQSVEEWFGERRICNQPMWSLCCQQNGKWKTAHGCVACWWFENKPHGKESARRLHSMGFLFVWNPWRSQDHTRQHDIHVLGLPWTTAKKGKVQINMTDYVKLMIKGHQKKWKEKSNQLQMTSCSWWMKTPSSLVNRRGKHSTRPWCKDSSLPRGWDQMHLPVMSFLSTRVTKPTVQDLAKLTRMLVFLQMTKHKMLTIKWKGKRKMEWCIDASFAVHGDFWSHTGGIVQIRKGATMSLCMKQKMNARSLTEAELIAVDDAMSHIIWSLLFMEHQGLQDWRLCDPSRQSECNATQEEWKAECWKKIPAFEHQAFLHTRPDPERG